MPQQKYYAVRKGHRNGVFESWEDCKLQVLGYPGAMHKSFKTRQEAVAWLGDIALPDDASIPPPRALTQPDRPTKRPAGSEQQAVDEAWAMLPIAKKARDLADGVRDTLELQVAGMSAPNGQPSDSTQYTRPNVAVVGGIHQDMLYRLEFDGASRGNPGIAGCGAVLYEAETNREVLQCSWPLRHGSTNNEAEYEGLIRGLQEAVGLGVKRIVAQGDSKLVCNQVEGIWKVNYEHLKKLREQAVALSQQLTAFQIRHVLRDQNKAADLLSNRAIDVGYMRKLADFVQVEEL